VLVESGGGLLELALAYWDSLARHIGLHFHSSFQVVNEDGLPDLLR
jgi:hypothetical protein